LARRLLLGRLPGRLALALVLTLPLLRPVPGRLAETPLLPGRPRPLLPAVPGRLVLPLPLPTVPGRVLPPPLLADATSSSSLLT
jgi:hypothetical protein